MALEIQNYAIVAHKYKTLLLKIAKNADIIYQNGPKSIEEFKNEVTRLVRESDYVDCLLFDSSYINEDEDFVDAIYYLRNTCDEKMQIIVIAPYNITKRQVKKLIDYRVYDIVTCKNNDKIDSENEYDIEEDVRYQIEYQVNNPRLFSDANSFYETFPEDTIEINTKRKKKGKLGLFGKKEEKTDVGGRKYKMTIASDKPRFIEEVRKICGPDKFFSFYEINGTVVPEECNCFIINGNMTDSQISQFEFDDGVDIFINNNNLINKEEYDVNYLNCSAEELIPTLKRYYKIGNYSGYEEETEADNTDEGNRIEVGSGTLRGGKEKAAAKAQKENEKNAKKLAKEQEKERKRQEKEAEKRRKEMEREDRGGVRKWPFVLALVLLLIGTGVYLFMTNTFNVRDRLESLNIEIPFISSLLKEEPEPSAVPELKLKKTEITYEYNEDFKYENYVEKLPKGYKYVERDDIKKGTPGTYTAVIELWDDTHKIDEASIMITVVDRTPPIISLETREVTFETFPEEFDCREYIKTGEDEVDGNIKSKITCSNTLKREHEQTITYELIDNSGNKDSLDLTVIINDIEATETPDETVSPEPTPSSEPTATPTMKFEVDEMTLPVGASQADIEHKVRTSIHRVSGSGESSVSINYSEVDTTKAGSYTVYYTILGEGDSTEVITAELRVVE